MERSAPVEAPDHADIRSTINVTQPPQWVQHPLCHAEFSPLSLHTCTLCPLQLLLAQPLETSIPWLMKGQTSVTGRHLLNCMPQTTLGARSKCNAICHPTSCIWAPTMKCCEYKPPTHYRELFNIEQMMQPLTDSVLTEAHW